MQIVLDNHLDIKDFYKAKEALRKANVGLNKIILGYTLRPEVDDQ